MRNRKPTIVAAGVLGTFVVLLCGIIFTLETRWFSNYLGDKFSNSLGQKVTWQGPLHIDWSWHPTVRLEQLTVDNPNWSQHDNFAAAAEITTRISLWQLAQGTVALDFLQIDQPRIHLMESANYGRNWSVFVDRSESQKQSLFTLKIRELIVNDGRITYVKPQESTDITGLFSSQEGNHLQVHGDGQLKGEPLQFTISSSFDLNSEKKTYPLDLRISHGGTTLDAKGTLTRPQELAGADFQVNIKGPDPARLNQLLSTNLPHLPHYEASAHLVAEDNAWYLHDIRAGIGESDFSGTLRWRTNDDERLMVWADLHSQNLHLDTLTDDRVAQASAPGTDAAKQPNEDDQMITQAALPKQLLQGFDAHIKYDVKRMTAPGIPIDTVKVELTLQKGALKLTPFRLGIGDGRVDLNVYMDTSLASPEGRLVLDVNSVPLQELLARFELTNESTGRLGGRGEIHFTGNSLALALANLRGELHLVMNSGRLDAKLVEAIGLDAGELMFGLLGSELKPVAVQCAYAKLDASNGIVDVKALTIATTDSNILGDGQANLAKETFDLTMEAHPKDFSMLTGSSPVRLHGSFSNPQIEVISDELAAQGALAVAAAAIFPPAALLPLVEPGETEGVNGCQKAVDSAKSVASHD